MSHPQARMIDPPARTRDPGGRLRSALKLWLPAASLWAAAGCAGAYATDEPPQDIPRESAGSTPTSGVVPTRVEVAVLEQSAANLTTTLPGEVEGSKDAVLASAQGGPVERVKVEEGDPVKRGQLIMQVDTALYAIKKRQAELRLASAKRDLKRSDGLGSALAEAERDRRQVQADTAQADPDLARLQLSRSRIVAPFSGVVAEIHTEVGEVVGATAPLARLVRMDPIHVVLSVPDRDVVALEQGTPVRIRVGALPGALKGTLAKIYPTGDQDTRAFRAEVEVDNPDMKLKPGMIATVEVDRVVADGVMVIPQDWLVTKPDGIGVFVVNENTSAHFVPVKVSQVVRDQVIIGDGLSPGVRLVITGHRDLQEGDALSIAREGKCCTRGRARF